MTFVYARHKGNCKFFLLQEFDRSRAFMFLSDIKRKFLLQFGGTVTTAIAYGMNSEYSPILAAEMKRYSQATDDDPISQVHGQLDELKDIMVKNIDELSARGERLELLVNKTEQLSASVSTPIPCLLRATE